MVQGMVMMMWWCSKDNYDDDNVGDDDDDEDDDDDCNHQTEEGGLFYKDEGTLADQQIISWGILSFIELNLLITMMIFSYASSSTLHPCESVSLSFQLA